VKDGENANAEWRENSRIRCCFIVDLKYHGKARKRTKRPLFRCLRARSAAKYLFLIEFLLWLFALLLCLEFVVVLKLYGIDREMRGGRGVAWGVALWWCDDLTYARVNRLWYIATLPYS
jgi:hypothetical protein